MTPTPPQFEAVIGLEVHAQLSTESKIFCGCRARLPEGVSVADIPPNSNTCPVCTAQPGALPVLNQKVVEYAVLAGLATNCEINPLNIFARKNYFYPDLPKGYQISQYDRPICEHGFLNIDAGAGARKIGITRIHMEEDAGKNLHFSGYSLVNLNRAGVPLIEIVSEPDMRTAEEAGTYLRALHAIVTTLGICDGNMQEGNFRCDANVSVRLQGSKEFGTRCEIKNVNSFRFVEKAIEFEIKRQIGIVSSGGRVVQETRSYDAAKNVTYSLRSKEEAQDYRYFPDPDLMPVRVLPSRIDELRAQLPELPEQKRTRFMENFGLSAYDAGALTGSSGLSKFFEATLREVEAAGMPAKTAGKPVANWLTGEVSRLLNEEGLEISQSRLEPTHLATLEQLAISNVVSSTGAKQALNAAWKSGESIQVIVDRDGLKQVSDTGALDPIVEKVIAAFPGQVAEYRAGKEKILGFLVGQVMKQSGGKANPALLQERLKKKLAQ